MAARPSSETVPSTMSSQGESASSMVGTARKSSIAVSIAACSSSASLPSGATIIAVAVTAVASGKVMWRRSNASEEELPGISKASSKLPWKVMAKPPSTASRASQMATTLPLLR